MKKIICFILVVFFVMGSCGCSKSCSSFLYPPQERKPASSADSAKETPKPSETGEPAQADIEFEKIDREVFLSIVTADGISFHQFVKDPKAFDIDETDIERGWGDISYDAMQESYAENRALIKRLEEIDKNQLSEMNKLAYDNIYECLTLSNGLENYYYYDEPLTIFNGAHTLIPLMLMLYEINSKADIENYLYLLDDSANYLKQLEDFEREKAERGLFMSENALDQVIASCRGFADKGGECFLLGHFDEVLGKAEAALSDGEKAAFKKRNESIIMEKLLPGYERLINTLENLRSSCGEFIGAAARGEEAKNYFCAALKSAAACGAEYDETANILYERCQKTYKKLNSLILSHLTRLTNFKKAVTTGSAESDIEYLKSLMTSIYPAIPEQKLTYIDVPAAVAGDFSPAAYLISAFDDPSRNVVLLNPTSEDADMLFTLAHECFPGHLYQTQYFRNMKELSLTQQAIAPTGYLEGWAVFSENFMPSVFKEYGTGICRIKQLNSLLANVLIPGYASLQVNTCGWTKDDIRKYIKGFGLENEDYVDILYEYAVDMPLYFFNYAMGYTYTAAIYESVNPKSNEAKLKFFTEYLNCGPCYYDILFEKFKVNLRKR